MALNVKYAKRATAVKNNFGYSKCFKCVLFPPLPLFPIFFVGRVT